MAIGVHFAVGSPGRSRIRAVVASATLALAVAGVAGSLLVGVSLRHMTSHPMLWNNEADHAFGNPFVPADRDIVSPAADDTDVVAVTAATTGSLMLDGVDVGVFAFDPVRGGLMPAVLEGRPPSAADEIALGRVVADQLGLDVGDEVTAQGPHGTASQLKVVGLAVSPSDAGEGAVMSYDGYHSLVADATRNLVIVRFRDGAPPEAAARVSGTAGTAPTILTPPTSVLAFERVVAAPFVLAAVLAAMVATGLAYQLAWTAYARRRDLAVLRALGADSRQLRSMIHWQALWLAGFGLVVGTPAGLAAGRSVHKAIADDVGVVPVLREPAVVAIVVIVGAVVVAQISALAPARRAARASVSRQLREP
jgi:putative ABC transport system permease protein